MYFFFFFHISNKDAMPLKYDTWIHWISQPEQSNRHNGVFHWSRFLAQIDYGEKMS